VEIAGLARTTAARKEAGTMIRVSVLYPNTEGKKFDMAYYCNKHIPMVKQKLGAACKRIDVDQGLAGAQPGSRPGFAAMCYLSFDSVDAFQSAFGPNAEAIMGDIPNYTDIEPSIQINEVKM
jgi:uncharacterized protein (TIGR02118 family)